jgi:NAD(P)-dependent dehydrogenase (short-subunit alcohol dehydrogenase family)
MLIFLCSILVWLSLCACELEFKNKIVLVTGGTTGIGYASALAFAREGAKVIITGRDSKVNCYSGSSAETQINSDEIVQTSRGSASFFKSDISKFSDIKNLFEYIEQNYGSLDIAINNAGIAGYSSNIEDTPDNILFSEFDPIINNLYGNFITLREEIRHFKKFNKSGSVVNVSSYTGLRSCPTCSLYSASKYGIIGLTKSVALENMKNPYIRVNVIAPGLVDTYLARSFVNSMNYSGSQSWDFPCVKKNDKFWLENKEKFTSNLLSGRIIEPEEIANSILYLSSQRASSITATVVSLDLGETSK